jgi:transposase, IS30 family
MAYKPGSHLTYELRCQIFAYLKSGFSKRKIARLLGCSHSTIVREVQRNGDQGGYRIQRAQNKSQKRRLAASSISRKMTPKNIELIKRLLEDTQPSPVQLSGDLKDNYAVNISHETIYKFIWKDQKSGGELYKNLRHRAKKYNKRSGKAAGRGLIPNRVDIDQRPLIVEKKVRFGDFELDTIVGANHKGAIVSIVDRASKYAYLTLVPQATAENIRVVMNQRLKLLSQKSLIQTYTSDNGKEFAAHEKIVEDLGGAFYFAKPYHSWERGLNEHTNGLVRQYFPKGTEFTILTHKEVAEVERRLNNRPRKILNFKTPAKVFSLLTGLTPSGAFQS